MWRLLNKAWDWLETGPEDREFLVESSKWREARDQIAREKGIPLEKVRVSDMVERVYG